MKSNYGTYVSYNTVRADNRGGNICVFIKEKCECRKLIEVSYCLDYIESLFLEVKFNNRCLLLLGVLYRPPGYDTDLFINKISEILSGIRLTRYQRVVRCGDFLT